MGQVTGMHLIQFVSIDPHQHMVEYDEIAYSMNIVSLFLVTYRASCEFMDAFHGTKCIPMVNTCMCQKFGTNFAFWGCLEIRFLVTNLFLPVKRTLLSFPEFSSIGAVILHEVPSWTRNLSLFYSPTEKKYFFPVELNHNFFSEI
jgi:hypothetical protein